ncbi:MAG TPA: efflux RND transporter periplasmic adaptor subunit, partial [Candidatus Obscuribacter sp.]|nr:efflux RND transporter periplasmic adaptor subunit [Candidatus Obscuribacter sp.]
SSQQAHERLSMGLTGGRREDVDIARAQKMEIEAVIKQLRWQIEQTVVRAPCSGVIMKRHVHLGDIASNTKTMFEIVRDGRLELKAQVPEQDLSQVKPGQTVEMTDDFGGSFRGQVREISPQVDQDMRLGTVRIDITNPGSLKPGNFLRGEILVGKAQVLVVPTSCVIYKGNRPLVYLVEDGKVKMSYVDVGGREGKFVEIVSGLKLGDQVVERGGGFLKDGDPVRVLPAEPLQ